ncbi:3-methyl-2-oxobutanoate hydroxymethyltransferase [Oceanobacillus sp. J11TS1]|uniref:3-methyl-2-oxobutanoate hydroxymethyltransferase n=1 Tax=Oceanobacillus sp. J11TS1 TaxID=2807191 RepID=UPI001B1EACCE|nr:3-methyl-2-oxobutanoate hydroxymethyltransferase [Oceanobacillus sp. J11TS1]GIO22134.1 3-methyl-2-oxobutanoate hydroxymethyltransferase [Oceanobacillus sp. J11TS1]
MKLLKDFMDMKNHGEKITMLTAYDYPSAKQAEQAGIDIILVGDSLGMTVLGYESTVDVTLEDMKHHARAARRGAKDTYIVVDMPFGTVGIDDTTDIQYAMELYRDTNANALKIEGAHIAPLIKKCTQNGIPIVAHLGLTPQSFGITGYKLQATSKEAAEALIEDAKRIEQSGAVMLVLEAIPSDLAAVITKVLSIPVIGIGAGAETDGQVLVYHDVLHYGVDHKPKFVKRYGDFSTGVDALKTYHEEVKAGIFPSPEFTYKKQIMDEVNE